MRLGKIGRSRNVIDRRGSGGRAVAGGLGGVGLLVVLAIGYFTGIDVSPILNNAPVSQQTQSRPLTAEEEQAGEFAARVLTTTENVWASVFQVQLDRTYTPPQLVLFSRVTQSGCGGASGATGPFYCPADRRAYLDTAFFATLSERLGAGGDFAAAYVIAHEVAHHVQNELGILGQTMEMRQRMSPAESNAVSVRVELQADCLSGLWASQVEGLLHPGDLEEALNAARKIGDDYLQQQAGRVPSPHTFTHGTSAQRARWFTRGYESANIASCDTFGASAL